MEADAAFCLGLAYHSAGEEDTAILVSLSECFTEQSQNHRFERDL